MRTHYLLLSFILFACGKEVSEKDAKSQVPKTDFNNFLTDTFPLYGNIDKQLEEQNIELLSFELSGGRTLTAIHAFSAAYKEAFVIWTKDDAGYHRLFQSVTEGMGITDVRERDLNNDGRPDLIVKSCGDPMPSFFRYTDILVDRSYKKIVQYESLIKNPFISPLILDLNDDQLPEFVTVASTNFPFGLNEWSFEKAKSSFFRNSQELFEVQNRMFDKGIDPLCEEDFNTPLLVFYPIRIYNINKHGSLEDVTSNFPDLLRLHMETVYNSSIKIDSEVEKIESVWRNYLLHYLDSYYMLKTDSSYLEYLSKQSNGSR